MPPIAIAVIISTGRACHDGCADTERNPAAVTPIPAAPMVITPIMTVMTIIGIMVAPIMPRTGIGRGSDRDHGEGRS
jgi:hypothetical protein